ncbi:MAG: UvrD-helicase domain-containing protein [Anaerolineae bacterium]|nr:UvrD-helicase domain-containing protein [Anaerolineae bacterium]
MAPILEGLNEQQLEAVTAPEGQILVLAGPGSGKTRVLTQRIAWLIEHYNLLPERIIAMTFTNKAAREMRARVEVLLGSGLKGIWLGTFHALCARMLRREADQHLPLTRDYVIFDTSDQRALMKEIVADDLQMDPKQYKPERLLSKISAAKNELIKPDQYRSIDYFDEIVKRGYAIYQQRLLANNAVDFDDLLMHAALLLAENDGIRNKYRRMFDHVLVDEFQDTNGAQYTLLRYLARDNGNLFCVGDEDQSIYRWRGADYRNMHRLRSDYPHLKTVLLEQNYRSTQVVLDAAQAVINKNAARTPKHLFTDQEGGPQVMLYEAHDETFEAQFVVDTIASLVAMNEVEPGECAVMYRTNAQSRALEDAFIRANLPYKLVGATRFYARKEIKDIVAYLRVIHNPNDSISLQRVINTPPRGIGAKTVESLADWAAQLNLSMGDTLLYLAGNPEEVPLDGRARSVLHSFAMKLADWHDMRERAPVGDLLKMVLDETQYLASLNDGTDQGEDRQANVMELVNLASEFEELPLSSFLEEVALVSDVDDLEAGASAPSLMTLHAAKGLEFDAVFIVGLEEGVLPHQRSKDDPEQMAEERRLMYVGMTRARKYLYLVYAFRRTVWGESSLNLRSRFIDDIPSELISPAYSGSPGLPPTTRRGRPPRARTVIAGPAQAYRTGQRVNHPKFGEGIIIDCRPSGDDQEVSVAFEDAGLKRLLSSFANLTVLDG